jgi:hypothetical protein
VNTNPPGARVILDDVNVGSSPFSRAVSTGRHTIRVELENYTSASRTIQVGASGESLSITLDPIIRTGQVHVFGPAGHLLKVDNADAGPLPTTVQLKEGVHSFEVIAPDGSVQQHSKDVRFGPNGKPVQINLR